MPPSHSALASKYRTVSPLFNFSSLFPIGRLYFVDGLDSTLSNPIAIAGAKPHLEDPGALMRRVG